MPPHWQLNMRKYITRRLLQSILVVLGVTLLTFFSLHVAGDPTYLYIPERATQEQIDQTRVRLGFDRPILEQYVSYLGRLLQGDLGSSLRSRAPAQELILDRLPATLELTMGAMFIATVLSIPLGIISALNRGKPLDGSVMIVAMVGQSLPSFALGIILILFISLQSDWIPVSGYVPIIKPLLQGDWQLALGNVPDAFRHLILPVITIAAYPLSRNARLVRSSMLEVLSADYIRTARSKGLHERLVLTRHALPNAIIPIVTVLALEFGFLLSGVVVIETIFSWPGVGRLVFNAINQRDIPVVQASVLLFSLIFIGLNLLTDLLYTQLDPRVRLE